jgi:hypothetical protein
MPIRKQVTLTLKQAMELIKECLPGTRLTPKTTITLADCGLQSSQQLRRFRMELSAFLTSRGVTVQEDLLVFAPSMHITKVAALLVEATKRQQPGEMSLRDWNRRGQPDTTRRPFGPLGGRMAGIAPQPPRRMRSEVPPRPPRVLKLYSDKFAPDAQTAPRKKAAAKKNTAKKSPSLAQASPLPTEEVRSIPHLVFAGEPSPHTPQVHPLALYLDQEAPDEGAETDLVRFLLPAGTRTCKIDVSIRCSTHFKIGGLPKTPTLTLEVASRKSDRLTFELQVLPARADSAADAEHRFVAAYFTRDGRPCGKVMRRLHIAGDKLQWTDTDNREPKPATSARAEKSSEAILPNSDAPGSLAVDIGAVPSDLRVTVLSRSLKDKTLYSIRCEFRGDHQDDDWDLPLGTREQVEALTERFMAPEDHGAIASLRSTGKKYWKIVPEATKTFIKSALAKGAKTLFVLSEEPWIPWELMIPDLSPDGPSMPLGALLATGRWVTGNHLSPPQEIRLSSIYVVSPRDSELENAADEVKYFEEELKKRVLVKRPSMPITLKKLDDGLCVAACDGLHFICHGQRLNTLQVLNFDEDTDLDCSQVTDLDGFRAAFKAHPFVFLNACDVGGVVPSLDGVTGFANSFIELEASAVVAPLWAVRDAAAPQVTRSFYEAVLAGKPFGEAIQTIRKRAYDNAGDRETYAAYCFYGDPLARLVGIVPTKRQKSGRA